MSWYCTSITIFLLWTHLAKGGDDDYNVVQPNGSFEFAYTNPDSYHYAEGNRNNVVRGQFGGRNPKTGGLDTTIYTAGPRGFRPRGKNIFRKYDLNQNGPRAIGPRDNPYYDLYEDPSYNFAFRTPTYSKQESANRIGDVTGKYSYRDDVGERHDVEYIAGKNTGFHVKTPFPDSNPRAYGSLYFNGRGRPLPRGRTSIQRGLDGSYKFVSSGPDQRRTEVSDSTGHVRGSYTYLDDKGRQHSVHYIAGPDTGYRVLKTVKGPHLPTVFPFDAPGIIADDFYEYRSDDDVFNANASGKPFNFDRKSTKPSTELSNGIDIGNEDYYRLRGDGGLEGLGGLAAHNDGSFGRKKPNSPKLPPTRSRTSRPSPTKPPSPNFEAFEKENGDNEDFDDNLFRDPGEDFKQPRPTARPTIITFKSTKSALPDVVGKDDGSYKPDGEDGSYRTEDDDTGLGFGNFDSVVGGSSTTTLRPALSTLAGYPSGKPTSGPSFDDYSEESEKGLFGSENGRPFENNGGTLHIAGSQKPCRNCPGTIVTNIGQKPLHVPPGVSVRAHVQSIDLYPPESLSPSEALKTTTSFRREQLNEAPSSTIKTVNTIISNSTASGTSSAIKTTRKDKD
ncbi:uncharacterized protein Cpr73D [Euwallacea fornicatus]|uniref:uncharacterized protein Cpr73D n=1 Tax=Euwallacea fornicatus TaxID=995702 RepID=UPI00338EF65C